MLTASQLFGLGNAVPVIGIYFRAADLLAAAKDDAGPAAARAGELLASFDARKPGVIANVRRVQDLLAALGASAGAPPRLPAEFDAWSQRVLDAVEAKLKPDHMGLATFHLIGRLCGDALQALNLAVYALALRDAAPKDARLADALAWSQGEQRRLSRGLRGAAGMLVPAVSAQLAALADELEAAPLATVADTQAAMKRCGDRVAQLEAQLAAAYRG